MKVQCLIPKYNNGAFFREALESLINQTVPFDSILICENHSVDGSEKIAFEYADKYPSISCFVPNQFAKTFGESVAELLKRIDFSADYIFIASSDDIWMSNFNEEMIKFNNKNGSQLNATFCDRWIINEYNKKIGVTGNLKTKSIMSNKDNEAFKYFSKGCSYIISGAYFKINVFDDLVRLAQNTEGAFDWFLMLEASRKGAIGYNTKLLFCHRQHENNTTKTQIGKDYSIYEDFYEEYLLDKDIEMSSIFRKIRSKTEDSKLSRSNLKNIKRSFFVKAKLFLRRVKLFELLRFLTK